MAVAALLAGGAVALTGSVASAATTLTNATLTVSNNAANVTGTSNTATYTWAFKTSTAATYTSMTFSLPAGATGTLTVTGVYGVTCSAKSAAVASTLVTLTLTGCAATASGTLVEVQIGGIKNGATTTAQTSTIVVKAATVSKGTKKVSYQLVNNTTAVTVQVPDTLTFTNNTTAVTLLPIPGGSQVTSQAEALKIKTNAKSGYKLTGCVLSANTITVAGGTHSVAATTIGQLSGTTAATSLTTTTTAFAAKAAVSGTGASLGSHWVATKYLGYATTCTATTGHSTIMAGSGPTSTNTLTLTNAAILSATQKAGTYTGTISYQVTPSY